MRVLTIVALSCLLGGCFLDRSGTRADGGGRARDAGDDGTPDAGDAAAPDAGGCALGPPTVVAALTPDATGAFEGGARNEQGVVALRPQPHLRGALRWIGYDGALLDPDTPSIDDLAGASPLGATFYAELTRSIGASPPNLPLGFDRWTIHGIGELYLGPGAHELYVGADDWVAVRLTIGASVTDTYARTGESRVASFEVPSEGWYPIEVALSDAWAGATVDVQLQRPGETSFTFVRADELRTDVSDVPGRIQVGWTSVDPSPSPSGLRVDTEPTERTWGASPPQDLGIVAGVNWRSRWIGLARFDGPRLPIFASANAGQQLFVDGVFLGSGADTAHESSFGPGWHEVVFDAWETVGADARARLAVGDAPLTLADLRAQSRAGGIPFGVGSTPRRTLETTESTQVDLSQSVSPFDSAWHDLSTVIVASDPAGVTVRWRDPDGAEQVVELATDGWRVPGTERWLTRTVHDAHPEADGTWSVVVDNGSPAPIELIAAGVLSHVNGRRDAYAATGTWTSAPFALDGGALDRVAVEHTAPPGTALRAFVRAAADEASLATAAWAPADEDGRLGGTTGAVAQLRLELSGDRTLGPRAWAVEVSARPCE